MTPEKARELTNSTEISDDVVRVIKFIDLEIERVAKVRGSCLDLTQFIPSYECAERGAWSVAINELRNRGFKVSSNYLGKAYSINGNYYSYYVTW